eukprot:1423503-Pyramimonas_sp.AAC.1
MYFENVHTCGSSSILRVLSSEFQIEEEPAASSSTARDERRANPAEALAMEFGNLLDSGDITQLRELQDLM